MSLSDGSRRRGGNGEVDQTVADLGWDDADLGAVEAPVDTRTTARLEAEEDPKESLTVSV